MSKSNDKNQDKKKSKVITFTISDAINANKNNFVPNKKKILSSALKFHQKGDHTNAAKYYQYFLDLGFSDPDVFCNYGVILHQAGNTQKALALFRESIRLFPKSPQAYNNLGSVLRELGSLVEAEKSQRESLNIDPNNPLAYNNLANTLKEAGNLKEAEKYQLKALSLKPNYPIANNNFANILQDMGRLKEAEYFVLKAIELKPDYAEAHYNLGNILLSLGEREKAIISFNTALYYKSDYSQAYNNLGNTLNLLGKLEEAKNYLKKAIYFNPKNYEYHLNLGHILCNQKLFVEALKFYKNSLNYNPNSSIIKAHIINTLSSLSNWSEVKKYLPKPNTLGLVGEPVSPLTLMHIEDNPLNHLLRAKNLYDTKYKCLSSYNPSFSNKKIRIGYFSANFNSHPVTYLMSKVFKLHNRSKFEIYIYSFGLIEDNYTKRLKSTESKFKDVSKLSDISIVNLARNDNLDLAIDLMGYTKDHRMSIFAARVAPIQINYLGFPASTGSTQIDYLIADKCVIPAKDAKNYSENIAYMPDCYMCFDDSREISKKQFKRADFGLPNDAFVLAAFHNNYKITPREIHSWSNILKRAPNTVLWLRSPSPVAKNNLLKEFAQLGTDINRIFFAKTMEKSSDHLSRHSCADLFIDTFNYNAQSTAMDSLWAGLPVVTVLGKSFCARVSGSLLKTINLSELIAKNIDEYESIIIHLANEPNQMEDIKKKLHNINGKYKLFNSEKLTNQLENVFSEIINREKANRSNSN